jgi:2-succinyl-5-enolpyruvyl-6-hydroxy-3-cyclohexene-1-carboxylate synthase
MLPTAPAMACATSMIDALVDSGVHDFVLSPGSRSAPLALALADREVRGFVRLHVRVDERSAGFLALGIARGSGRAVAMVCTSGTAVANLHPAVVEADYSAVPLVLLTADRPPELRGVGASQTIKQAEIFGASVRWFADVVAPERGDVAEVNRWRNLAAEAVDRACAGPGPVHLNLAFRPPLVGNVPLPSPESVLATGTTAALATGERDLASQRDRQLRGDTDGAPEDQESGESSSPGGDGFRPNDVSRGLLLVGDLPLPPSRLTGLARDILLLAETRGWPVIAEPTANLEPHPNLLAHGPLIAGSPEFVEEHQPDLVISIGRFGLSRAVTSLVSRATQHWALAVDDRGEPADPVLSASRILESLPTGTENVDPNANSSAAAGKPASTAISSGVASTLSGASYGIGGGRDSGWLNDWMAADRVAGRVVRQEILEPLEPLEPLGSPGSGGSRNPGEAANPAGLTRSSGVVPLGLSGAGAALAVWESALPDETVFLASSWPIRFIDSFAGCADGPRVMANRGANGIDGLVSTSLGIVAALGSRDESRVVSAAGSPTGAGVRVEPGAEDGSSAGVVAILGDVAFLHDIGGLVGAGQMDVSAVLVVLNNDGGGIFSQLEQAEPEFERDFERVFGTPHGRDLAGIARSMGVSGADVRDLPGLRDALMRARAAAGVHVIVAHTSDRREEAVLLRHVAAVASAAINDVGA